MAIDMANVPEGNPRTALPNVLSVLEAWLDRHNENAFPWLQPKPSDVENVVGYPLEPEKCVCGHTRADHKQVKTKSGKFKRGACNKCGECSKFQELIFIGTLDLIAPWLQDPKVMAIVDHKTTAMLTGDWVKSWEIDSQLTGYIWAAGQRTGKPVHMAFINAIEMKLLPTSDRKCSDHGVPYSECSPEHLKFQVIGPIERSAREIEKWKADFASLARKHWLNEQRVLSEGLRNIGMEGRFSHACSRCEFLEFCIAGRPNPAQFGLLNSKWKPESRLSKPHPRPSAYYVDNSIASSVAVCSTQATVRYALNWTADTQKGALLAGTSIHKGLEVWFKGGDTQKALKAAEAEYRKGEEPSEVEEADEE